MHDILFLFQPSEHTLTRFRECSRQLTAAIASAARASMTLPGGPLAVFGLPTIPDYPSITAAAAAVVGFAVARANDIFNIRTNSLRAMSLLHAASPHALSSSYHPQWPKHLNEGEAFCACLRLQRLWRGHCGRIQSHIQRSKIMNAALDAPVFATITVKFNNDELSIDLDADTVSSEGGHGHAASSPDSSRSAPLTDRLSGSPVQPPQPMDSSTADARPGTVNAHAAADDGLSPDVAAAGTSLALLLRCWLLLGRQLGP